jgi:hypothetical protein
MSSEPTPLDFLRAVYLNDQLPLSVRMRAAEAAAPYCHPKLTATAFLNDSEAFAERLERALNRSGVRVINHRADEHSGDRADD